MLRRTPAALLLCVLGAGWPLLSSPDARAQSAAAVQACAKRAAKSFSSYGSDALATLGDCRIDGLKDDEPSDCLGSEDVWDDLANAAGKLRREMRKCNHDALRVLCPHGERDDTALMNAVLHAPDGFTGRLLEIDRALYETPFPGCPRPQGEISRSAEDCADRLARLAEDAWDDVQKCAYKCELNDLRRSGPQPCFDAFRDPIDAKVGECIERVRDDLREGLGRRCSPSTLVEIGCPLGMASEPALAAALADALADQAAAAADEIFRSGCGGSSGGSGGETPEAEPVPATLYPSQTPTFVMCGMTLGPSFFGSDDELRLDADLDCGHMGPDSNGLVVTASDVSLEGRSEHSLTGPSKTSFRTGTGILVGSGATGVTIRNFRQIQRYGVGVGDSGTNPGLTIREITVRRNRIAGVRTRSPDVRIEEVRADRNAIGFDVSGEDSTLADSLALRSEPAPHIGIYVHGFPSGNGRVVRVNRCTANENRTGILVADGEQLLEDNVASENLGDGIVIESIGSKVEDSTVKRNGGNGIVVSGQENLIVTNRSDENTGHGFLVSGERNQIHNNRAGSLTHLGNGGRGFALQGFQSHAESNQAEANLQGGFLLEEATARFANNRAAQNSIVGFEVAVPGNRLDTNLAENNGVAGALDEFWIAPGNVDGQGNRRNGTTFSFGAAGGQF